MRRNLKWCFGIALIYICFSQPAIVQAESNGYETVSFTVTAQSAGYHHITVSYEAVLGGGEILREIRVNGNPNAEVVEFRRFFVDQNQDWRYIQGNQLFPSQVEVARAVDFTLAARPAIYLNFWLEAGINTIDFVTLEGEMTILDTPTITPATHRITYAEYAQLHSTIPRSSSEMIIIQAQEAAFKTSRSLFPINDRTCPLVAPYHHTYITLNAIGGWAWRVPGQLIEWDVYVPESGMYRVALRYAQRDKRGFSSRALTINGVIPFGEAAYIRFDHGNSFSSRYLGCPETGEDFWFYFQAGHNTIGLEATLGVFETIVDEATQVLVDMTRIYQDIIMITSATPSIHRDYLILGHIPDLRERLRAQTAILSRIIDDIDAIGGVGEGTAIVERLIFNANRLADRPYMVAHWLNDFQVSIAALSTFIVLSHTQPLLIDVIGVGGENADLFRARANFFQRMRHSFMSFIGSFTNDFNVVIDSEDTAEQVTVEVWISSGFDMFNNLGRAINEQFVSQHPHINIDLRLVDASIVFPASLTGRGPDVVVQGSAAMPINFAHRGGAIDLTQFADFEDVASRFAPAAIDTFRFLDGVYALPDQMTFDVMFYRTDIFEELGITAPNTMDEFLGIMPILQTRFMEAFLTTLPQPTLGSEGGVGATTLGVNTVYAALLHQRGGGIYSQDGSYTRIADEIGLEAFQFWTDLYTKHNFIFRADVLTRFRMGSMPIAIADLGVFNMLNATAPEIRGNWAIVPIPGMYRECGEFRRDGLMSVSSNFIVGNTVERRGTHNEAWEFLKWFTSYEAQLRFALDAEAVWGHNWRYQTANLEAFKSLSWGRHVTPVLEEAIGWSFAVPQVPGGYIAGRSIRNAFNATVVDNMNPAHELFFARDEINAELTLKRREFGIYGR
ncbi:MAG: extracellular solute-binding protein [Defluviitaleaceae bacterium]|nr:extracellular solute-binding protein [Defluviitaleaceae bacterium]